jgi:hypothetical protein
MSPNNAAVIVGKLHEDFKIQVVSEKFQKREFVIEMSGEYPQYISIQLTNQKCDLLNNIAIGSELTVHCNIKGRAWQKEGQPTKYFNTLEAWKIEVNNAVQPPQQQAYKAQVVTPAPQAQQLEISDDLPF